ncbi:MAG: hypothetical protein ACI37T_03805 [Candidatus Gastranaerophilaceae bacterium]
MYRITKFGFFIVTSALLATAPAFADGLVFDPESYPQTVDIVAASSTNTSNTPVRNINYNTAPKSTTTGNMSVQTRENNNLQNALFELDSAQVDVRNQLLDAKAKYTNIDNQYKMIKEQRKIQKKAVRDGEKRVKQIEKTKEQIRKNMQIQ